MNDGRTGLPAEAYAAALAALDLMTVSRLRTLLRHHSPHDAWELVTGRIPPTPAPLAAVMSQAGVASVWQASARRRPPESVWQQCLDAGIGVSVLGHPDYPPVLAVDHQAPAVLFHRGDLGLLSGGRRRVGIVGTRNATAAGRSTATTMAGALAENGVDVVSGLARGIDGSAHRGCLERTVSAGIETMSACDIAAVSQTGASRGRPIGVVASGLDVVYPKEHARLWQGVADQGVLLSESPPATPPEAFRFPLRNRIIAALSEVLVVVESRASGGSLITVDAARARQVTVLVVPGSAANTASAGTNALARDGCGLALDVDDVLCALGLDSRRASTRPFDPRPVPTGLDEEVLATIGADAVDLDTLVDTLGRPLGDVALALGRLEASGWLQQTCGWFERSDAPVRWT